MQLLDLPPELLTSITSHLRFPETTLLRATCRVFATLIPPQASDWQTLLAAEDGAWARRRNRLACVYCARLLPAARFTDREKSRKKAFRACVACWDEVLRVWNGATKAAAARCPRKGGSARREVRVDGWNGVCGCCEGVFVRWGGRDAARSVCCACAGERLEKAGWQMGEAARLWRDLEKVERPASGTYWDFDWELQEGREGQVYWDWGYGYCSCCVSVEPQTWRDEWRGINIRRVEDL
ncbi:hypothetical protein GTA08_BOTSDO05936 [Botryosphaeria dothidea]|uniref:F-box domain-containing protein n=1 Tax=Botryosphaeria dothidea TaxID=55169 RepID=A0A8H4IX89_9PEZI|nr:hypothetical protein GTA08_BOTSDO05936 [Botryosphaeria dothidea]